MSDKLKILSRIRKLLALAGDNSSDNEAQFAMDKARDLMAEHNFSDVEIRQVESLYVTKAWRSSNSRAKTRKKNFFKSKELVAYIGALNDCVAFTKYKVGESCFFGEDHDVETCIFMMELLQNAFVSSWQDYLRSYKPLLSDESIASQRTSFENGMLFCLLARLDKMIKDRKVNVSNYKASTTSTKSRGNGERNHTNTVDEDEEERRQEMDQAVQDAFMRDYVMPKKT